MDLKWIGLGLLGYILYKHYGATDLAGSLLTTATGATATTPVTTPAATVPATTPASTVPWWLAVAGVPGVGTTPAGAGPAQFTAGYMDIGNVFHVGLAPPHLPHVNGYQGPDGVFHAGNPPAGSAIMTAFALAADLQNAAQQSGLDLYANLTVDQWNVMLSRTHPELTVTDLSEVGITRDAAGQTPMMPAFQYAQLRIQSHAKGLSGIGVINMRQTGAARWTM